MRLKIWCDGKYEKFYKIFWELNKALIMWTLCCLLRFAWLIIRAHGIVPQQPQPWRRPPRRLRRQAQGRHVRRRQVQEVEVKLKAIDRNNTTPTSTALRTYLPAGSRVRTYVRILPAVAKHALHTVPINKLNKVVQAGRTRPTCTYVQYECQ